MAASRKRDIVVVGASAGGVEALKQLFNGFPTDFPAAIFVVVHIWPEGKSILPDIISRAGTLPAEHPRDGDPIRNGRIYIAPPDYHLMIRDSAISVVRGPRENRQRPSVDSLFRSASIAYGRRVVGVLLTGNLNDGTAGLIEIKQRGGLAIVQDPGEAMYPGMPQSAIDHVKIDHVLDIKGIRELLVSLPIDNPGPPPNPGPHG